MIPIALAAAAVFSVPVADAVLASNVADTGQLALPSSVDSRFGALPTVPLQEQIDAWWADDGAKLIAEAVQPQSTLPIGFALIVPSAIRLVAITSTFTASSAF